MNKVRIINTDIDNVNINDAVASISNFIKDNKKGYVVTPNVDHIVRLDTDKHFQEAYEKASFVFADGKPLIWISKKLKTPLKSKISGSDLFPKICELAAQNKFSITLFGAAKGVAEKAAENLRAKYPGINILGTISPEYGFEKKTELVDKYIFEINKLNSDILVLGLGTPKQELFVYDNFGKLNFKLALCVGASIDFEAGNIKRAPKWISNIGMEWFYRFLKEPKRLFKRYFVDDMKIFRLYRKYKRQLKHKN